MGSEIATGGIAKVLNVVVEEVGDTNLIANFAIERLVLNAATQLDAEVRVRQVVVGAVLGA